VGHAAGCRFKGEERERRVDSKEWRVVSFAVELQKIKKMANPSITIPLDPQTARAYDSAGPEQKRKIQALLSLWLRELAAGEYPSLQKVLEDAGRKAKDRGLTPEVLDSLLRGVQLPCPFDTNSLR
jgi:hypothetical protein